MVYKIFKKIENCLATGKKTVDRDEAKATQALMNLKNGNIFLGCTPKMYNSSIIFDGENNILYCEPGVMLSGCNIHFQGNNSLLFFKSK